MRPDNMPRPHAPEHSDAPWNGSAESHIADNFADNCLDWLWYNCGHDSQQYRSAVEFMSDRDGAYAEIERLRAEVAELVADVGEMQANITAEANALAAAESQLAELRRRVAEARAAWIVGDDVFRSEADAIEEIQQWGPSDSIAKRIRLLPEEVNGGQE